MSLRRYNPWSLFDQLQHEINQYSGYPVKTADDGNVVTSDWAPAVDIKEDDNAYLLIADIPGVDPKDIEIHMENGILTIKGQRESEKKTERKGYKRIEREHGVFYRRFTMPEGVNADGIEASNKNGVLTVTIPKQPATQARRITVN
ncbi:MAG: Hsp20/alpha crystallin family protein [Gammaproteobacteria bacterium]|nr:Hsp20/alpha crystallin family protein [Gammaproteobacteria bacterium]MDH5734697.1 Hsp20/alpha crystallin family protein [Gammaproteobacteria bacterium]